MWRPSSARRSSPRSRWLAAVGGDPGRARRAAQKFAEHDREVLEKLYAVHRDQPGQHISVSNELRDQLARTLREDEEALEPKSSAPSAP